MTKSSRGARLAGELPTSFKALSGSSSSDRAHISSRAKCSSSRSLYYADGYEFQASSRQDLRRSASALYRTVDCGFDEPSSSSSRRSSRHEVRRSKNANTTSRLNIGCSSTSSSFRAPCEITVPLRADDCGGVIGRRNIISGWSFGSHRELPATGEQEESICRRKKTKKQEDAKDERGEDDHTDARVHRGRRRLQLLQSEDESAGNCVSKNVHKKLSQSCQMEIGEAQSRTVSSTRHGSSQEATGVHRKLRSLSLIVMGYDVGILQSDDKTVAAAALQSPSLQGSAQRKENCWRERVYHNLQRKSDTGDDLQAAKKLERAAIIMSSGELDVMAFVGERDFARSLRRSQLGGASFTMEGGTRSHGVEYCTSPSPKNSPRTSLATAAVPFNWEEAPGKPKTTAAAVQQRAKARSVSKEGMELSSSIMQETEVLFQSAAAGATSMELGNGSSSRRSSRRSKREPESPVLLKSRRNSEDQRAVGERSHRYYNQFATQATEKRLEWSGSTSSGWLISQEKEIRIDLVAPAAAKFLVEEKSYNVSPVATPPHYAFASPGAVPFKWEETPGKPKVDAAAFKPKSLQLPPRLAIPHQRADSFSGRDLRAHYLTNHSSLSGTGPLAGFFTPCLMSACSSPRQQNAAAVFQPLPRSVLSCKGSKLLPRKLSNSSTPQGSYRNSSTHTSILPPSCEDYPHNEFIKNSKISNRSAFSAPLVTISPAPGLQPRRLYSSELKASHPWIDKVKTGAAPDGGPATSTPTTHATAAAAAMINSPSLTRSTTELHAPDSTEILSQVNTDSASNPSSLSRYLDALAQIARTPSAMSASEPVGSCKSSSRSQASYESLEQELGHMEPPAATSPRCSQLLRLHHTSGTEAVTSHHTKHNVDDSEVCPSVPADTAAAAALEMQQLSPSDVNLDMQQHRCNAASSSYSSSPSSGRSKTSSLSTSSRWTGPRIRHRVRFIFSMCKALKRMLFRQQHHRKLVAESKLQFPDDISLPGFPFVKAN